MSLAPLCVKLEGNVLQALLPMTRFDLGVLALAVAVRDLADRLAVAAAFTAIGAI